MNRFGEEEQRFSFYTPRRKKSNNPNTEKWDHYKALPLTELVALCGGTTDEKVNNILGAFDSNGKLSEKQQNCLIFYCIENLDWED